MSDLPLKVTTTTGVWNAIGTWLGALGIGGVLIAIVRQVVPYRKLDAEKDAKLIDVQAARIEKLEGTIDALRTEFDRKLEAERAHHSEVQRLWEAKIDDQRVHYESKLQRLHADYEAGQRTARHGLANAKMRQRSLVMLLKRLPNPPEGLFDILSDIEAMEAEQEKAEAAEKGAVSGAKIAAAGGTPTP